MKKMKGDMIDIFATFVMIGGVIATVFFLRAYFISYSGEVETPMENIEALQAAYAVERCLTGLGDYDYITADVLDEKKGEFVGKEDFCNIPYPPIHAEVTDIETGEKWEFTRPKTVAALKAVLVNAPSWLWDKITFWESARERSQPKHEIFVPILYNKITGFGKDDQVIESWKKYVIVYSKINDDLKLDIYPIERYDKDVASLQAVEVKTADDLKQLTDEMKNITSGTERTKILTESLYRRMTAGDLRGSFELTAETDKCGSLGGKICITLHAKEIHGGKLYVEI